MYISKVQSQQINPYYRQKNATPMHRNIAFGSEIKTLQQMGTSQLVTQEEAVEYIQKLTKKIKFFNDILGKNGKTTKYVLVKLGEADVYMNIDKTLKNKVKINLCAATNSPLYVYAPKDMNYIPNPEKYKQRQMLDIILNSKDGRMSHGYLATTSGEMTFERNTKTGHRRAAGEFFGLCPNINECYNRENFPAQRYEYDKASNIVSVVFKNIFDYLSKVKPDIKLM